MRRSPTGEDRRSQASSRAGSERRQRLIAQILRDFMAAYALARRIGADLRAGTLAFADVDRLVGDSPRSILYRLKEDCHALFRDPEAKPSGAPTLEELFDLAVGALFHEAMRFRESYYLYTTYGPRARRSLEGSSAGTLAPIFRRLFDAGHRRMVESEAETEQLFMETREQLRVLLRGQRHAEEVARALIADPEQTAEVFELPLERVLEEIFGAARHGYALALRKLLDSGHYAEAAGLLDRLGSEERPGGVDLDLVRGLAAYYEGNPCGALRLLREWVQGGARTDPTLDARARTILRLIAYEVEEAQPDLAEEARRVEQSLTQRSR